MSTRQEVYAAIDSECTYRTKVEQSDPVMSSVADCLVVLDCYLRKAQDSYTETGIEPTLHQLRRLGAVLVRCMEDHGALPRVMPEPVPANDDIPW